ncbi:MAG: endo-1,3-alpha-glucanase family glycosylhydrolase, partial [Planctomycetota bacterium]
VQNVDPGFKIIPSIYAPGKDADPHEYAKSPVVRRALQHPSCYRLPDGRRVLSMWRSESQPPQWWKTVLADLKKDGIDVALLGHFNSPFDELKKFGDVAWAMTIWGTRSPQWDYAWPRAGRKLTDVVGTPIAAQDIRTRGQSLWEAENFDTLRSLWHSARKHDADYAFIISWNDFSEQAQMPSERVGYALHDLNAYYTTWFKTGRQPAIVRDVLYYSYRRQHSQTRHTMGKPYTFRDDGGRLGDKAAVNKIELLAFLTEPGTLTVEAGGKTYTKKAPAGITSFKVPMPTEGEFRPVFTLVRDGRVVVTGKGRTLVTDRINFPDLLYNCGVIAGDD